MHSPQDPPDSPQGPDDPAPDLDADLYLDLLTRRAADVLEERRQARIERNRWWLTVLGTLGAVLGGVGLWKVVTVALEIEVREAVLAEVDSLKADLESSFRFTQFAYLATAMRNESDFARLQRSDLLSLLEQLAQDEEITKQPEFIAQLEPIISVFHEIGDGETIDRIRQLLGPRLSESQPIVSTMIAHYGERLVGSTLSQEAVDSLHVRFREYVRHAARHRREGTIREVDIRSIFWRLLVDYSVNDMQLSERGRELADSLNLFSVAQGREFGRLLEEHSDFNRSRDFFDHDPLRVFDSATGLQDELLAGDLGLRAEDEYYNDYLEGIASLAVDGGSIAVGDSHVGSLGASSQTLPDKVPGMVFSLAGSGQEVTIDATSRDFDTVVYAVDPDGFVVSDDDGGEGCNSRLVIQLADGGEHRIVVSAFSEESAGRFGLQVTEGAVPFSDDPC